MGLDAYFNTLNPRERPATRENYDKHRSQIAYWRKFWPLQQWMESLWFSRKRVDAFTDTKVEDDSFNCVAVRLNEDDLIRLEVAYRNREGPFDDENYDRLDDQLGMPILDARIALAEGKHVYYDSWW